MIILGIETSCDETGVALVEKDRRGTLHVIHNSIATSLSLHAQTGGIIPESAAREQLKYMLPTLDKSLNIINNPSKTIDVIAVTVGPGLIGSLLVGVETAKTLSYLWNKPLVPVNHLYGHIYANFLTHTDIPFPSLALVVSGNHTDLVLLTSHTESEVLGSTRDDAAGEAFDKIGRLLGLPYPAGPLIAHHALNGNPSAFQFPRPMKYSGDFDFSFSGLKTAVLRTVTSQPSLTHSNIADICASTQEAIVDLLVYKTVKAAKTFHVKSVLLGGGVAANEKLRNDLSKEISRLENVTLFVPEKKYCTDNGAMICAAAAFKTSSQNISEITVDPELFY